MKGNEMAIQHRKSSVALAAGVIATAMILGGCAGDSPDTSNTSTAPAESAATLDDLYAEVVAAGEDAVLIYGPGEAAFEGVYARFSERFPEIEVTTEFMFGGDLDARLQQEATTGQHAGDLVHLDDVVRYKDMMQAFVPAGDLDIPETVALYDGTLHVPSTSPYVFAYNADKISEDEVPTTWADVVSSNFTGKIGMSDPTSLAATSTVLYSAYQHGSVDEDWFAELAARNPTIYQSSSQMVAAIPAGEIDFTPVAYYGFVLTQQAQGANVQASVPTDGIYLADSPYGLLDGAPHPLAAQLLVSWLLSDEGQAAIAEIASEYPTMPGAPAPAGLPPMSDLDVFELPAPDDRISFKEDAVEFLGTWF